MTASIGSGGGPTVSVLMPNMNNAVVLDEVLEKLVEHTTYPSWELIVSDDGSTDESLDILRRWERSGRIPAFTLLAREHAGIIPTLNAALDAVGGEMIVRIDGDTTVETPGWLERMLAFHALDPSIGLSVGRVIFDSGHVHTFGMNVTGPEGLHERGTQVVEPIGERTVNGELSRPLEQDSTDGDEPAEVDAALGCWTMFSTELARELGGWDMGYNPVWYEDIDFAFAVRAVAGKKNFYLPDVRIVHHTGRRDPRLETSKAKLALLKANRAAGRFVPETLRGAVAKRAGIGEADPKKLALLESHRAHWQRKWGFDPVNPDVDAIRGRYAGTEVLWAEDPARRRAGEEILDRHRAQAATR
jgi:glycosyltransferase involved in cell wall biosynthesis